MKKYLIIILSVITMHTHAMETENTATTILKRIPIDILDRIAHFLLFHDVETKEEFIARTKALQSLEGTEIPEEYITQLPFDNITSDDINRYGYCPNNVLVAVLHESPNYGYDDMGSELYLSIINRKKGKENPTAVHEIDRWSSAFRQLAISRDGNWVAIIGSIVWCPENSGSEALGCKNILEIINLSTKEKKQYDIKMTTVAFNKQGTDVILHDPFYPHQIIPLSTDISDTKEQPQKTLAKYCAQRGICKNLVAQFSAK